MQLFFVFITLLSLTDGFINNIPKFHIIRNNIIKKNAVYTSYNPLSDNYNITKQIMIIIPDNNSYNGHLRSGYPKESVRNIT